MSKRRKLSHGQQRRVRSNANKRLDYQNVESKIDDSMFGPSEEGRVVCRFGQHVDIEDINGQIVRCNIRRTVTGLVTGDRVVWRCSKEQSEGQQRQGIVEAVHPRHSQLSRPDYYDGLKPVAANIDQIIIVSAVLPEFSAQIVDRYLVAAENAQIAPVLLLNKVDLLDETQRHTLETHFALYRELGYQMLALSTKTGEGLDELQELLKGRTSVFVGQSGVGKSSLINALLPEVDLTTKEVSEGSGLGQHTTTTARLYHFPAGGELIDSPGVREFALWHLDVERVCWCFVEFRQYLGGCKFRDCKHSTDPGCLIREAMEQGAISSERYRNYHRIIETMQEQAPTRHQPN